MVMNSLGFLIGSYILDLELENLGTQNASGYRQRSLKKPFFSSQRTKKKKKKKSSKIQNYLTIIILRLPKGLNPPHSCHQKSSKESELSPAVIGQPSPAPLGWCPGMSSGDPRLSPLSVSNKAPPSPVVSVEPYQELKFSPMPSSNEEAFLPSGVNWAE